MRAFTVALLFTSMAACGDDAGVVNPNNDTEVDATTADALLSPDLVSVDSASPVDTAAPQDVGSACEPGEGCFNEPCSGPDDCNSGICTMHVGDKVCSKTCDSECPEGWTCQLVSGGSDGQYVCVSNFASLCLPCESAEGCAAEAPTACVEYPDGVSFCGGACDLDKPCPGGYSCQEVTTTTGAEIYQCVADTGTCSCSALAIGSGLATGCSNENEYGACEGLRVCGEDGLGECDAGVPAEEICNGLDDDCDGEADEGTCDDGNACTQDSCGGVEGCLNTPPMKVSVSMETHALLGTTAKPAHASERPSIATIRTAAPRIRVMTWVGAVRFPSRRFVTMRIPARSAISAKRESASGRLP
jgi:hypothetical protein